jgi:ubiquitin-protein ligase E3 C
VLLLSVVLTPDRNLFMTLNRYNNLMFLKTYTEDVSDLCLTFTVSNDDFGVSEVPLIANGANIEITNENKRRYICE